MLILIFVIPGFDDTCDMSAVLGILSSASVFSPDVQRLAKDVRSDVRNPWGHCNFQEWTDTKLTSCFKLMKDLVQALNLPADDEKRITEELGEWETKGKLFPIKYICDNLEDRP